MSTSAPPPPDEPDTAARPGDPPSRGWTDVKFRWVNLLLLIPLISILPFLFNQEEPTFIGLPFFYWFQMAVIPIGIACTVAVHRITRHVDEEGDR